MLRVAALQRRRLGRILVGLGLAIIVIAVVVVLEIANGPGTGPKAFAQRRGYDQVKVDVQRSFPLALLAALGGMALAIAGARLARRSEEVESKLGPTDALHGGDT
jgi:ABC-type Fe3+ transport system permease subunit